MGPRSISGPITCLNICRRVEQDPKTQINKVQQDEAPDDCDRRKAIQSDLVSGNLSKPKQLDRQERARVMIEIRAIASQTAFSDV